MSDVSEWWSTNIIEMEPGSISLRGTPIENLIGKVIEGKVDDWRKKSLKMRKVEL